MKVDKAVCTNDKTLDDLNCVIKFDAVFTTLVENKILAIKRECEQKELNKKKTRSIGRLLFGRTFFCDKKALEKKLEDVEIGELQHHPVPRCENGGSGGAATAIATDGHRIEAGIESSTIVVDETCLTTEVTPTPIRDVDIAKEDEGKVEEEELDDDTVINDFEEVSVSIEIENPQPTATEDEPSSYVSDLDISCSVNSERKKSTASEPIKSCALSVQYENGAGGDTSKYLTAKSISAQSTPILPRPKPLADTRAKVAKSATPTAGEDIALASTSDKSLDKSNQRSSSHTTAPTSNLVNETSSAASAAPIGAATSTTGKKLTKRERERDRERNKDYPRLEYEINYQANPLSQGFISNFNQLTSNLPVLATSVGATSTTTATATCKIRNTICDSVKLQRSVSTANEGAAHTRSSEASGSDDEYKKRKRKNRFTKRCSDPILVYPTTGGLQQCSLIRPPNQPLQYQFDDDYVYDMSLEMEAEKNGGNMETIVPDHRKHKHRHHHHHHRHHRHHHHHNSHHHHQHPRSEKKKKHKRRKILVHDLDDQSVKVIDPDDLPKRARWTIIATACLLLIMCLLLVGVTLRMAPIIDDMVRQENERLMLESYNRARFAESFTDPAPIEEDGGEIA